MTKYDKNCKGSTLTYRVTALESHHSGGISEPDDVLWFYKQRNNIVHSGHSEVPLTDSDLRRLEYTAKNTILYICDTVKKHSISDTNELISWIERKNEKPEWVDAKEYFIKFCGDELRKYAERLNRKNSNSNG